MRKTYLFLLAFLLVGAAGDVTHLFGQSYELSSNIPASPLEVGLNFQPDTLAVTPVVLTPIATVTGGIGPYSYSWSPSTANYSFPGDSSSPELTIDTGDPLTTYTVVVSDANGCTVADSFSVDPTTNVYQQIEKLVSFQVFPNPNNGSFHVSMKGKPFSESFDVVIKDQVGRWVYLEHLSRFTGNFERDFEVEDLSSGVYLLGFGSGSNFIYRKLVIE